jgi:hypothetical protein
MSPHACSSPHFACFFAGEASAVDNVSRYLIAALRAGQPAIGIANRSLLDGIRTRLHREHAEGKGGEPGKLVLLDAEETLEKLCLAGKPDAALFHQVVGTAVRDLAAGGKPVAAYGDMVGVLCERGRYDDALTLEGLWNDLLREVDASLLCGYQRGLFDAPEAAAFYDAVRATHSSAYDERSGFVPRWI